MEPSDCIKGKWYYFNWAWNDQPVYFKYMRLTPNNGVEGYCSIWETGYTTSASYPILDMHDLRQVSSTIPEIQSKLPSDHEDKVSETYTEESTALEGRAEDILKPGNWYMFDWDEHRNNVIGKIDTVTVPSNLVICSDSFWGEAYQKNVYYDLQKVVRIRSISVGHPRIQKNLPNGHADKLVAPPKVDNVDATLNCVDRKWYSFIWLHDNKLVYVKHNKGITSRTLFSAYYAVHESGAIAHTSGYRPSLVSQLKEVDVSIPEIQRHLPDDHEDKIPSKLSADAINTDSLIPHTWYEFKWNYRKDPVIAKFYSGGVHNSYFITNGNIWDTEYSISESYKLCEIEDIIPISVLDPRIQDHLPDWHTDKIKFSGNLAMTTGDNNTAIGYNTNIELGYNSYNHTAAPVNAGPLPSIIKGDVTSLTDDMLSDSNTIVEDVSSNISIKKVTPIRQITVESTNNIKL